MADAGTSLDDRDEEQACQYGSLFEKSLGMGMRGSSDRDGPGAVVVFCHDSMIPNQLINESSKMMPSMNIFCSAHIASLSHCG